MRCSLHQQRQLQQQQQLKKYFAIVATFLINLILLNKDDPAISLIQFCNFEPF
jgi:hypothetical protein